jgi:hypothetical protein
MGTYTIQNVSGSVCSRLESTRTEDALEYNVDGGCVYGDADDAGNPMDARVRSPSEQEEPNSWTETS